jgi:hypothetical protein
MSMEHKAYLFDWGAFEREVRAILEQALRSQIGSAMVEFIAEHVAAIKDPYEGEALGPEWEQMLEAKDVHQYGDFALTKYYDPTADIGLGHEWETSQEALAKLGFDASLVLGVVVGTDGNPFDPGKLGSYFQSEWMVEGESEKAGGETRYGQ